MATRDGNCILSKMVVHPRPRLVDRGKKKRTYGLNHGLSFWFVMEYEPMVFGFRDDEYEGSRMVWIILVSS